MKFRFEISGDYHEDDDELRMLVANREIYNSLHYARDYIRGKLKYDELTDNEVVLLEGLQEILYCPSID